MKNWLCVLFIFFTINSCNKPELHVIVHGELKKIMHGGARKGIVKLSDVLENDHVYGLGAMENLDGEIIIMDNEILISRAEPGQPPKIQTEITDTDEALLLVSSQVKSWQKVHLDDPVHSKTMDDTVKKYADKMGIDTEKPFPFIIEGEFETVDWHIISSPEPGGSHDDHLKQSWKRSDHGTKGTILGFYSEHHKAIFTHHTTFTHLHILYKNKHLSGHVDDVKIASHWTLSVPK